MVSSFPGNKQNFFLTVFPELQNLHQQKQKDLNKVLMWALINSRGCGNHTSLITHDICENCCEFHLNKTSMLIPTLVYIHMSTIQKFCSRLSVIFFYPHAENVSGAETISTREAKFYQLKQIISR